MKVRYNLLFDRKKEVSTKGVGLVQIQVYLNGSRRYFSTKFYFSQKEWNIKKNSPKDPYTAKLLRERIAEFEKFEVEYTALHQKFQLSDFDLFLNTVVQEATLVPIKLSFTEFYKNQLEKETKLKRVTLTNQKNYLLKLTEFKKVIEFEDLNYSLLQDFEIFYEMLRN
jgi:hypothetical protein